MKRLASVIVSNSAAVLLLGVLLNQIAVFTLFIRNNRYNTLQGMQLWFSEP